MQIEQLHLYGKNHPETGLHKKVIGVQFSEKIPVRDPYTKRKDMKDVKPFMVNHSVNLFEKGMVALDPKDLQLKEQLEQYSIKAISPNGRPTYTDENEHFVDAFNLAMLGFALQYDAMIRVQLAKRIAVVSTVDRYMSSGTTLGSGLNTDVLREDALNQQDKKINSHGTVVKSSKIGTGVLRSKGRKSSSRLMSRTTF